MFIYWRCLSLPILLILQIVVYSTRKSAIILNWIENRYNYFLFKPTGTGCRWGLWSREMGSEIFDEDLVEVATPNSCTCLIWTAAWRVCWCGGGTCVRALDEMAGFRDVWFGPLPLTWPGAAGATGRCFRLACAPQPDVYSNRFVWILFTNRYSIQ